MLYFFGKITGFRLQVCNDTHIAIFTAFSLTVGYLLLSGRNLSW